MVTVSYVINHVKHAQIHKIINVQAVNNMENQLMAFVSIVAPFLQCMIQIIVSAYHVGMDTLDHNHNKHVRNVILNVRNAWIINNFRMENALNVQMNISFMKDSVFHNVLSNTINILHLKDTSVKNVILVASYAKCQTKIVRLYVYNVFLTLSCMSQIVRLNAQMINMHLNIQIIFVINVAKS